MVLRVFRSFFFPFLTCFKSNLQNNSMLGNKICGENIHTENSNASLGAINPPADGLSLIPDQCCSAGCTTSSVLVKIASLFLISLLLIVSAASRPALVLIWISKQKWVNMNLKDVCLREAISNLWQERGMKNMAKVLIYWQTVGQIYGHQPTEYTHISFNHL